MNQIIRRAVPLLLSSALLFTAPQAALAAQAPAAPLPGYRSQPFETGYLSSGGTAQTARRSYPRRYSLEAAGEMPGPSAGQGGWNTAWAIAAARSAESSLYQNGSFPSNLPLEEGLSERLLAWSAYAVGSNPDDPADSTGAAAYLLPQEASALGPEARFAASGNFFMAASALARWSGTGDRASLPYPEAWMFSPEQGLLYSEYRGYAEIPEERRFDRFCQLREVRILPHRNGRGEPDGWAVKHAMLDGLAPAMALSMDPQALGNPIDSGVPYYAAQEEQAAKQALTLVGWNDDIPAAAFADGQGRIPAGPGAWLARSFWADGPEFLWISYYSQGISDLFAFVLEPARYDHNYQHDGLGPTALLRATGSVSMAGLFTASGAERLDAVGFYTADHGVNASVQIYTGFSNTADPSTGTPCLERGQSVLLNYAGYHTLELDQPVALAEGETFAVVVTLSGKSPLHLFVEQSVEGYAEASVYPGRSLLRAGSSGVWTDPALGERPAVLCVKAFTTDLPPAAPQAAKLAADVRPAPSPAGMERLLPLDGAAAEALSRSAFEKAARQAKSEGRADITVPVAAVNYTDLLPEGREAILRVAGEVSERTGIKITPRLLADTVGGGRVLGRLYLDPAACAAPLRLGVFPDDPVSQAVFDNHFANPVRTVRLMNQGEFGAPAVAAFAADLVGLLPDRLTIYRYSDQANSYRLAEDVVHSIDERGYLRLILPAGGCYVIADRALELR